MISFSAAMFLQLPACALQFSRISLEISLLGLTKPSAMIASAHPADEASLQAFRDFGAEAVTENRSVVKKSDVVFLSVKPNVVKTALEDVKSISSGKLFVSIAMGITLSEIEQILPSDSRVIRVMPNTPAIVRAAASVFVRGCKATENDTKMVSDILKSIGSVDEVPEYLMDPVTALSGSGPAYVRDSCYGLLLKSTEA